MQKSKPIYISQFLYAASLFLWIFSLFYVVLRLITGTLPLLLLVIFFANIIQGFCSGAFGEDRTVPSKALPKKVLDHCIGISQVLSIACSVLCLFILLGAGGGPKIVDGDYCIVDHGEIVKTISKSLYWRLTICERLSFACMMSGLSATMAKRIRTLYLLQEHNKKST